MKKKFLGVLLIGVALFSLVACSSNGKGPSMSAEELSKLERNKQIEVIAKDIINNDISGTDISEISVNKNLGLDDGSYVVLPYLKWNVMNRAKGTREMLTIHSNNIAAKLAKESDVSSITIFWEVPYHLEGENIAKFSYERVGDKMMKGDVWLAARIRE